MSKLKLFYQNSKSLIIIAVLSVFISGLQPVTAAGYSGEERININVYEKVAPAVVSVDVDIADGISSGTGLIVRSDGLILTSRHVVEGNRKIKVTIYTGEKYDGEIVNNVGEGDFALIKINPEEKLPIVSLGNSEEIKVGQKVLAIGNPFGFDGTFTEGIISRIDKEKHKIQTDAAINPGCSGGPLLNTNGEVIGINQSIYNPDNNKSNIGIGFAIPVNIAKSFITKSKKQE